MDAKSSAGVPLSSPAAAQRCAKGAGLDSGAAAAAQSAMPSIALPATASTADLLSTNAAAPAAPQLPSVSNLHQLDGRDPGGIMKEFVLKGRLTLERVVFRVSAKTLEGALARAANGDFDGYDTDAAESVDWQMALASIEENT
jgi:hypothetical protein